MIEGITDRAAWQHAPGHPLQICAADLPQLAANEIRIRNAAIAINPIDWILQEIALLPWLEYPAILGSDVAGEVEAVGAGVERFKVGDRV
ncbi:MAG: alcohol dehydrogenase catalytic domain-containing protein, partial [Novosphingobium sp.]|nr:alcohol dehydrogenase catalytic domain-containing protein [Novosphingobium sp.]